MESGIKLLRNPYNSRLDQCLSWCWENRYAVPNRCLISGSITPQKSSTIPRFEANNHLNCRFQELRFLVRWASCPSESGNFNAQQLSCGQQVPKKLEERWTFYPQSELQHNRHHRTAVTKNNRAVGSSASAQEIKHDLPPPDSVSGSHGKPVQWGH